MLRHLTTILLVLSAYPLLGQEAKFTVSGTIQDAASGESLIGATVWCQDLDQGTATNAFGFYTLTLPEGPHTLWVSFIGYQPQLLEVVRSERVNVDLVSGVAIGEAVVEAASARKLEEQVQMSRIDVPIDQIRAMPAIGGEVDLLKALQFLPGVQSGGEGTTGLYVRGGSPDQNLMLLDGVPLYSVNHLFGFFSVFNADAVKSISLTKGGFPARYGGRLSSILEVNLKDGHMSEYHVDGTMSLIASKVTVEGPLVKDNVSFMLSGRRTYIDLLARPLIWALNATSDGIRTDPAYFFQDFNGKVNWRLGDRNRLYFSAFNSLDDFGIATTERWELDNGDVEENMADLGLDWKNSVQAMRWAHEWGPRLFSNTTLLRSKYQFNTGAELGSALTSEGQTTTERFAALYRSGIQDLGVRSDHEFTPHPAHAVRYGVNWTNHRFSPGATSLKLAAGEENVLDTLLGSAVIRSNEVYGYAEDEWAVGEKVRVNAGVHGAVLAVGGERYPSLQPRLACSIQLPDRSALKLSFARMSQFVNLLTNEGLSLPTDLWVPSTARIRPQQSVQYAAGWARTFGDWEVSLEGYWKDMDGLLSYKEGASFVFGLDTDWQDQVVQGIGRSYGLEVFVQRKVGDTKGWIGYTWSKTERKFDELNDGNWFPFTYDRRHDVSLVVTHVFDEAWTGAVAWVFGTGRALTLTETEYMAAFDGELAGEFWLIPVQVPSERNAYRMSPYHRLDLSMTRTLVGDKGSRQLVLSIYNAYNNLNPFFAQKSTGENGLPVIREYGIFPIIPSVSWRVTF